MTTPVRFPSVDASGRLRSKHMPSMLPRWMTRLATSPATAKIAIVGDSTSDPNFQAIGQLKTQLTDVHILAGGALAGVTAANIVMRGVAGAETNGLWNNAAIGAPTVTQNPDLLIWSSGINDVRFGNSTATLVSRLIAEIDLIRAALPNVDLVLRIPNSMTTDGDGTITAAQAQTFTDSMRNAYLQLVGRWTNCVVWNGQDQVFGRRSRALANTDGLMTDQLHPSGPGVRAIADSLVETTIGKFARV